jgi:hypothetical protein
MLWYALTLERAARPSGFSEPSILTRQSLVLGSFFLSICKITVYIQTKFSPFQTSFDFSYSFSA